MYMFVYMISLDVKVTIYYFMINYGVIFLKV